VVTRAPLSRAALLEILGRVLDPEVPALSVVELGIVRDVRYEGTGVVVDVTPTYSGCPAMREIESEIQSTLEAHGVSPVRVNTIHSPPWTTDWMSDDAKAKLRAYGIAPPAHSEGSGLVALFRRTSAPPCPHCGSLHTEMRSEFGSTACKAICFCLECRQPFEHFKPI
jgi:ring-1,2-phenylacetyl-CoA epoxidase subunit PaaD